MDWAKECAASPKKSRGNINEPFVLGAIINVGRCLNLTDVDNLEVLRVAHQTLKQVFALLEAPLPVDAPGRHELDCMVINAAVKGTKNDGGGEFDTTRGAYIEGEPIYPGATLYDRTHIQICVRNPECICGYFLPDRSLFANPK